MTATISNTARPDNLDGPDNSTLYRLLANYWICYDALDQSMSATDATAPDSPERADAEAYQMAAGDRLQEASIAICRFVPTRGFDARYKHDFLVTLTHVNGGSLVREEIEALLSSLPGLISPRQKGGAA